MLLQVTRTYALVACVVMVALVASAYAGSSSCAPDSCCVAGSPCVAGGPCPTCVQGPHAYPYCPCGRCCQPSHPWGYSQRQWSPWPFETRDDVGSPAAVHGEIIPTPKGTPPVPLPAEEYPAPETEGGMDGVQIQGTGTGETPMPFDIPPIAPGGMDSSGLPGLPTNQIPLQPEEGVVSPDILPAQPFSIEGAEEENNSPPPKTPAPVEKPVSQESLKVKPLPEFQEPIQLGEAPLPTGETSSLVLQTPSALPSEIDAEIPETSTASAPLPNSDLLTSLPSRRPAPTADVVEEFAPVHATPVPSRRLEPAKPSDWHSRRTRSFEAAPLPTTKLPAEGSPVSYQQAEEAPMPEVIQVPAVIEQGMPLGLDGYCPVELVLNERWIEGDAKWTATHQDRSYQFSSCEAFDAFCRNPELYAPYYGGIDPIIALVGGGMVDGRTDLCAVYHGRLYMFSSQESLDQFRANPTQCIVAFKTHLKAR